MGSGESRNNTYKRFSSHHLFLRLPRAFFVAFLLDAGALGARGESCASWRAPWLILLEPAIAFPLFKLLLLLRGGGEGEGAVEGAVERERLLNGNRVGDEFGGVIGRTGGSC